MGIVDLFLFYFCCFCFICVGGGGGGGGYLGKIFLRQKQYNEGERLHVNTYSIWEL